MLVGVQGFEPWTPCSQSRCATGLRHTPKDPDYTTSVGAGQFDAMPARAWRASGADLVSDPVGHALRGFRVFRLYHHANQRLGAGRTYEYPSLALQFLF